MHVEQNKCKIVCIESKIVIIKVECLPMALGDLNIWLSSQFMRKGKCHAELTSLYKFILNDFYKSWYQKYKKIIVNKQLMSDRRARPGVRYICNNINLYIWVIAIIYKNPQLDLKIEEI